MVTTRRLRHGIVLALVGLLAGLAVVLGLDWTGTLPGHEDHAANDKVPFASPSTKPDEPAKGAVEATPAPGETAPPPVAEPNRQAGTADQRTSAETKPAATPPPAPDAGKTAAASEAPTFDIVRVEPNGDAVVAGRGKPNTVVEMLVDGKPVARALADPNGQFALVPPALPKGSSEIVLRSKTADGNETRSAQSVAVSVPADGTSRPLVALTTPGAPTVVLSQPGASEPRTGAADLAKAESDKSGVGTADPKETSSPAHIVSVDSEPGGRLFVTGSGKAGSHVRLYLNDTLIAPARIGPDGRVTFTIGKGVAGGRYQVRMDEIDPKTGKVLHRAEVPFAMPDQVAEAARPDATPQARPEAAAPGPVPAPVPHQNKAGSPPAEAGTPAPSTPPGESMAATSPQPEATDPSARRSQPGAVFVPAIATAKISRGDNLWQISKRTYGRGERYTVIYDANQNQIRDPDLIYPGQIFVLPNDQRG